MGETLCEAPSLWRLRATRGRGASWVGRDLLLDLAAPHQSRRVYEQTTGGLREAAEVAHGFVKPPAHYLMSADSTTQHCVRLLSERAWGPVRSIAMSAVKKSC